LPQRILLNTPLRGTQRSQRKNRNEEKQVGDKEQITVR